MAEAAALLLRPRTGLADPAPVKRGIVLQRRRDRPGARLPPPAARAVRRRCSAVRGRGARRARAAPAAAAARPPPGAAAGAGARRSRRCRCAAIARRRAIAVGLVTQSWRGWAADVGQVARRSAPSRARRRRRGDRAGAALGRALVAGGQRRGGRRRAPPSPTPARSCSTPIFNRFTDAARRAGARRRARAGGRARASKVGEVWRSTPRAARRRRTPTSPGWARPSASCSTTRCSATSRAPRRASSWPTSSPTSATATCRAACSSWRSSLPPAASRSRGSPGREPSLPALLAAGAAVVGADRRRRQRPVAAIERRCDASPLRPPATPARSSTSSAASRSRTSPTRTRRAGSTLLLGTHPTTVERIAGLRARRPARHGLLLIDLREVLDALPGLPLGVVVGHGVDELLHEPRARG